MHENYHLLVESISDYSIFMLDKDGIITTWNIGAERSKGYKEEEIVGKHFSILFLEEDRYNGKPEAELRQALLKGRYEEEGWRLRKDGSRFWSNVIVTPVFNEVNEHIGFAKITRDLTEKRRQEELYLLLVKQVKEYAIFMMDTQGNVITWNEGAERIKQYAAHEIIGKNFSNFYLPDEKAANKPAMELQLAMRTGKYEEEGWRVRKDGSTFWANIVITPVYTDKHIGFAKVTRDLTRRREMETLARANIILETTNKELEKFAFTASHDLREPLRKISTYCSMLLKEEENGASESRKDNLSKILRTAKRIDAMVEDILNFSTLSNKQHFESYDLKNIVTDVREVLEQSINEKQAVINYSNLPNAVMIPAQMRQLFQNVLSNAIKFSRKGIPPVIDINCQFIKKENIDTSFLWPSEQYLKISIRDNGIGFDQQDADKIFNLFDRLHSRSAYEGSGLGLAICKKIAENHGGMMYAESKPGEGAEFSLILPA
jgi:PAS domain S-box-containing protein